MSREDRQALLHEGMSTTTTLSAYVEVSTTFSNDEQQSIVALITYGQLLLDPILDHASILDCI